jgi:tetratricopeptide (TPR) repeat protein
MPSLNYLESSGWLNSLRVGKPIDGLLRPIPWYSYPAIEFIEDKLKADFRIFEYGSGQSTLWYAERLKEVISVEHNSDYFKTLLENLPQNVNLLLRKNPQEYAREILNYDDCYFDIIVIDGIERVECSKKCDRKLKENGFIIFDNSDREGNNPAIQYLQSRGFKRLDFYGLVAVEKYKTCTSIFFKDEDFLNRGGLPSQKQSCLGISLGQAEAMEGKNRLPEIKEEKPGILACYEAIKKQPNSAEAYKDLGDAFQAEGKIQPAIKAYKKALELNQNLAEARVNLNRLTEKI